MGGSDHGRAAWRHAASAARRSPLCCHNKQLTGAVGQPAAEVAGAVQAVRQAAGQRRLARRLGKGVGQEALGGTVRVVEVSLRRYSSTLQTRWAEAPVCTYASGRSSGRRPSRRSQRQFAAHVTAPACQQQGPEQRSSSGVGRQAGRVAAAAHQAHMHAANVHLPQNPHRHRLQGGIQDVRLQQGVGVCGVGEGGQMAIRWAMQWAIQEAFSRLHRGLYSACIYVQCTTGAAAGSSCRWWAQKAAGAPRSASCCAASLP